MVSYMRSEPALPLLDQTPAENHPSHTDSSKPADDSASVHSGSSKSWVFRPPSLRRRGTDKSMGEKDLHQHLSKQQQQIGKIRQERQRTRSTSTVLSEEEGISGLGIEVEMELHAQGMDAGQWGIADEARMNLE